MIDILILNSFLAVSKKDLVVTLKKINENLLTPLLVAAILAGVGALINISIGQSTMNERLSSIIEKITDHETRLREMERNYYRVVPHK